jgi:hypothetical protein
MREKNASARRPISRAARSSLCVASPLVAEGIGDLGVAIPQNMSVTGIRTSAPAAAARWKARSTSLT